MFIKGKNFQFLLWYKEAKESAIYLKIFYLKVLIIINIIMNNKLIDNIILKYANKSYPQNIILNTIMNIIWNT